MSQIFSQLPNGYTETVALIAAFDRCFIVGFTNLSHAEWETLAAVERVLRETELGEPFAASCAALRRNEFVTAHFVTLAAARVALQGALHDALLAQIGATILPSTETPLPLSTIQNNVRHWLMEVALLGFARLEVETLTPFLKTLETVQGDPGNLSFATLLTGFVDEMLRHLPLDETTLLYRWVDLWTQAMVNCAPSAETTTPLSDTIELYGMDLRQTTHAVSFVLHGISLAESRPVRITQSAYKVNAIRGDELWLLFPQAKTLLTAFSATKQLAIDAMPLRSTGDLIWDDERTTIGKKFKLLPRAAHFFSSFEAARCGTPPRYRHPAQIALPYYLERSAESPINWSIQRNPSLDQDAFEQAKSAFGLLRFDAGEWSFQPMVVAKGLKLSAKFTGQTAGKMISKPPKRSSVAMLQERASRLLRA